MENLDKTKNLTIYSIVSTRGGNAIAVKLEQFKNKYKVSASDNKWPGQGKLDPVTNQPLFTPETHDALENCKEKPKHFANPLPNDQMYHEMPPNPNAKHGHSERISYPGESKLESWHENLVHLKYCGMGESTAYNLNLYGTARYSLRIQHKLQLWQKQSMSMQKYLQDGRV